MVAVHIGENLVRIQQQDIKTILHLRVEWTAAIKIASDGVEEQVIIFMYMVNNNKNKLYKRKSSTSLQPVASINSLQITAKLDSGATSHYFKPTHHHALSNVKTLTFGPSATLPDNSIVTATKIGTFNLHQAIDKSARTALSMPNLKMNHSSQ